VPYSFTPEAVFSRGIASVVNARHNPCAPNGEGRRGSVSLMRLRA
jgi:hypothetical protein